MVRDGDATAEQLAPMIEELLDDKERLAEMGRATAKVARPHAAEELAEWVLELARG
jgi:UDP-N-acetylglucosamine:LPS N-acetylglucosamine transferase